MARRPERYYRTFVIPKGRKKRVIHAPKVALKVIQKWLAEYLGRSIEILPSVFGFVRGRSAIDAAAIHCGAKWVYSIDIRDFFSSTPERLVLKALIHIGYSSHAAYVISSLCCYQGFLAQGAPTSPVLSNLVFADFDRKLVDLATSANVRISRYADDIVFSGQLEMDAALPDKIKAIVLEGGWVLADEKEHVARAPARLKVHGLLVHGDQPRLTKGYRNRLRAYAHLLHSEKLKASDIAKVKGHLSYAKSVTNIRAL